jgi:hypothetical protein
MINKEIDIEIDFKRIMEKRQRLLHIKLRVTGKANGNE